MEAHLDQDKQLISDAMQDSMDALPSPDPDAPVDRADVIGEGTARLAVWAYRFLIVSAAAFVLGWGLSHFSEALMPVLLALLITSVLWPITAALKRYGVPYGVGALISLLSGVGVVSGLVWLIAPSVMEQWPVLQKQAIAGIRQLQAWAAGPPLELRGEQLNEWIAKGVNYLQANSADIVWKLAIFGGSLGSAAIFIILTLVMTFFFLKDGHLFLGFVRRVVGRRAGFHSTELLTRLWNTISGYIRTQAIVSFADAVFIGLGLVVLGVPLAFPIAVLTFMAGFIPVIGAVTAGALAVLVAIVSNGWTTAVLVLVLIIVVQQVEGNILQPMLQSRVMNLHPVIVLVAVLLGGTWMGILGAFLAVPVAASIAVVLRYLGDLIDLRTGDRTAADIDWATDDGHVVAHESERSAAFFKALVQGRRHSTDSPRLSSVEKPKQERTSTKASLRSRLLGLLPVKKKDVQD